MLFPQIHAVRMDDGKSHPISSVFLSGSPYPLPRPDGARGGRLSTELPSLLVLAGSSKHTPLLPFRSWAVFCCGFFPSSLFYLGFLLRVPLCALTPLVPDFVFVNRLRVVQCSRRILTEPCSSVCSRVLSLCRFITISMFLIPDSST